MPRQHSVKTEALSKTEADDNPLMDVCAYPSTSSVQDARGLMSSARIEARPQKQEHVYKGQGSRVSNIQGLLLRARRGI